MAAPFTLSQEFFITLGLSVLDIAVNAAAGAAATAAGASREHADLTIFMVKSGALAGTTKAGIIAFMSLLSYGAGGFTSLLVVFLLSSSFGIAVLLTYQVSSSLYDSIPSGLLIAAVVAAIPLSLETMGIYHTFLGRARGESLNLLQVALPGMNALGGYVFARMAHNKGTDVCSYATAAAAGAVYGVLTGFFHFILGHIGKAFSYTTERTTYYDDW